MKKTQITIVGGGNLAHFSACVIGSKEDLIVNLLTRKPKEWVKRIKGTNSKSSGWIERGVKIWGTLNIVSDNPKEVSAGTNVFLICAPAHVHQILLEKIAPFVEKNTFVGTVYGQGGFDLCASYVFRDRLEKDNITLFGLQTVPSISQICRYGKCIRILGPKKILQAAAQPSSKSTEVCKLIEKMYGIPTVPIPNFLSLTLVPSNQIIHPARVYGVFKDWDGKSVFKPGTIPKLYADMDDFSADLLQLMDDEIQAIKRAILKRAPNYDLSYVIPIHQRIINSYGDSIKDPSTLKSTFRTNSAYSANNFPLVQLEGGVVPNLDSRFFWEDIPYGLCILKDIAEMAQVPTPVIDKMIEFHQKFMGKEFIKNGKLNKAIIHETGAPSKYGIRTLDDLLKIQKKPKAKL